MCDLLIGRVGVQVSHVPTGAVVQVSLDQGWRRLILCRYIHTDYHWEFLSGLLALAEDARIVVEVHAQRGTVRLREGSLPAIVCWVTKSDDDAL